jgi:hypothetical protein
MMPGLRSFEKNKIIPSIQKSFVGISSITSWFLNLAKENRIKNNGLYFFNISGFQIKKGHFKFSK